MTIIDISATANCDGTVTTTVKNEAGTGITFSIFVAKRSSPDAPVGTNSQVQGPFSLEDGASITVVFKNAAGANDYGFDGTPVLDDGQTPIINSGPVLTAPINCTVTTSPPTTAPTTLPPTTIPPATISPPTTPVVTTTIPPTTTVTIVGSTTTVAIGIGSPATTTHKTATTTATTVMTQVPVTGANDIAVAGMSFAVIALGVFAAWFGRRTAHNNG